MTIGEIDGGQKAKTGRTWEEGTLEANDSFDSKVCKLGRAVSNRSGLSGAQQLEVRLPLELSHLTPTMRCQAHDSASYLPLYGALQPTRASERAGR